MAIITMLIHSSNTNSGGHLVVEVLGVMCPCIYVHLEAVPHHLKRGLYYF